MTFSGWPTATSTTSRRKSPHVLLHAALVLLIFASVNANSHHDKKATQKSYVCPPNFMRLSYKCYYFSNTTATWQEAYWKCRDMKSNIATIKNGNQDKIVRRTLDRNGLVPYERWIGGRYDWGTMSWKWAASGREIQYQGFADGVPTQKEALDWHCIILDPAKHYRWGSRSCTESKHYVCQTKMRKVDTHDKRKLQKQYESKLNEVAVPEIFGPPSYTSRYNRTLDPFASYYMNDNRVETAADDSNNAAMAAYRPQDYNKIRKKNKKDTSEYGGYRRSADTISAKRLRNRANRQRNKQRREKTDGEELNAKKKKIRYMTYYEGTQSPLQPRIAVEDFRYSK